MKVFTVTVQVFTLVGSETRELKIKAKTLESAHKKVATVMGNRDFVIKGEK